jgi:hypothetical protein
LAAVMDGNIALLSDGLLPERKVPQLAGSDPPNARDTLAVPQLLWQDTGRG